MINEIKKEGYFGTKCGAYMFNQTAFSGNVLVYKMDFSKLSIKDLCVILTLGE